jgi:uncharacterized protein
MIHSLDQSQHPLARQFMSFVGDDDFPCVGAKSALAKRHLHCVVASDINSTWDDLRVHREIERFVRIAKADQSGFWSCVVLFEDASPMTEEQFERALWARLQSWSDKDEWLGFEPGNDISIDIKDPDFALSFVGEAFFAVGLHPGSSRLARRFGSPVIVLNPHWQFKQLRSTGRYDKMRQVILDRDEKVAGSINPMLATHGSVSEARQYSGRATDANWQCPFARGAMRDVDAA